MKLRKLLSYSEMNGSFLAASPALRSRKRGRRPLRIWRS